MKTFQDQHGLLRSACAQPAKGDAHSAVTELRKSLKARLDRASQSAKTTRSAAENACGEVAELIQKRSTWAKPILKQTDQVLKKGDRAIKPGTLKVLLTGVDRLDQKITTAGKKCDAALAAYIEADTELETLQGR